jgi:transcriptional regulator with XRE-family HTH domain
MSASWLKTRREELNLSQDDLAARLQLAGLAVSRAAISHWETGRDNAPIQNRKSIVALADALQLTPNELLMLAGVEPDAITQSDAARYGALIIDRLPPNAQKTAVDQLRALERLFAKSGS